MRWADALDVTVHLKTYECVNCGMPFAVPADWVQQLYRNAGSFYCPSGHKQGWWETETDRLRKQLKAAQHEAANAAEDLNVERAAHRQTRGELGRVRRRAAAALCPAGCGRSFVQVRRHLTSKHPGYQEVRPPGGADNRRRAPTVRLDERVPEAYRGVLEIAEVHRGGRTYRCACGELFASARGIAYAHADHCQPAQRAIRARQALMGERG